VQRRIDLVDLAAQLGQRVLSGGHEALESLGKGRGSDSRSSAEKQRKH
jgi:hypothetical protein